MHQPSLLRERSTRTRTRTRTQAHSEQSVNMHAYQMDRIATSVGTIKARTSKSQRIHPTLWEKTTPMRTHSTYLVVSPPHLHPHPRAQNDPRMPPYHAGTAAQTLCLGSVLLSPHSQSASLQPCTLSSTASNSCCMVKPFSLSVPGYCIINSTIPTLYVSPCPRGTNKRSGRGTGLGKSEGPTWWIHRMCQKQTTDHGQ